MSRHGPQFEKDDRASVDVVAPTVRAAGELAGEYLHASSFELPAAATNVTPSAMTRAAAELTENEYPPPRLMFATAGVPAVWLATIQSRPAITPDQEPEPLHDSTRTGTISADFATPHVAPATVPATCVPCPWQSSVPTPSLIDVNPVVTRPVKSTWADMTPVSTM